MSKIFKLPSTTISSTSVQGYGDAIIALGGDKKMYFWDIAEAQWVLYQIVVDEDLLAKS